MNESFEDDGLLHLQKQFFNLIPVNALDFARSFSIADGIVNRQNTLLNLTLKHPCVEKFPIKLVYQRLFLKNLIAKLENSGFEVSEELYVTYCNLLSAHNDGEETHFRHFVLDTSESVILKESASVISQGTTGLCSWHASLALAEWCISHHDLFNNKHVLELGSGVGLTGLTVSLRCKPRSYWFSDCHPAVLSLLKFNVKLNNNLHHNKLSADTNFSIGNNDTSSDDEEWGNRILLSGKVKKTDVKVLHLPWEEVAESNISSVVSPDIILGADVVYDESSFCSLIKALKHFLIQRQPSDCVVLLACTVRNPKTTEQFLNQLKLEDLELAEECLQEPSIFIYSTDLPIKLFKIYIAQREDREIGL